MPARRYRVEQHGAVATGSPEDRIAGVAEQDGTGGRVVSAPHRLVDGHALGQLELGSHRPGQIGQLVGELFGELGLAVGHGHDRPPGLVGVQPALHRERRDGQHPPVVLHLAAVRLNSTFIGPRDARHCSWCVIIRSLRHAIVGALPGEQPHAQPDEVTRRSN